MLVRSLLYGTLTKLLIHASVRKLESKNASRFFFFFLSWSPNRHHSPKPSVTVAGPLRKGKSYILSEAFDQPEVFPLGHEFDPETMGIWMWIVPEKYKVQNLDLRNLFPISHSNTSNYIKL